MPELLRAIAECDVRRAYWLLRSYQERNDLPRGFAGFAWYHLLRRTA